MKTRLYFWSVTSALAGFLFGFDTVVISGAEQTIQSLWKLSPAMHGFAMASALYGTVLGSLLGSWPTDKFGRKATLTAIGVLYILSAIGCGFAWDVYSFIVARFIGGIGIGVSTVVAPLYISEIAPPAYRGRLAGMFQFNIVFGIIMAFLSNYLLKDVGEHAWRWMLGVAAFPSVIYTVMCFGLPKARAGCSVTNGTAPPVFGCSNSSPPMNLGIASKPRPTKFSPRRTSKLKSAAFGPASFVRPSCWPS